MISKILQVLLTNIECRGLAVQSRCVSILLFIFSQYYSQTGTLIKRNESQQHAHFVCLFSSNALARIVITNNPTIVFKDNSIFQSIKLFLYLIKNRTVDFTNNSGLWCFEGLLALTNVLSVDENVCKYFASIDSAYHTLETCLFDDNNKIVTSALECFSNLFVFMNFFVFDFLRLVLLLFLNILFLLCHFYQKKIKKMYFIYYLFIFF